MKPIEEIRFARTVQADIELAKLCPDNNLGKLKQVVTGKDTITNLQNIMKVIVILSEAYENKKHFEDPEYKPNPVTLEQLYYYTEDDVLKLSNQAFADFSADGETSVEAEAKKESAE